MFMSEMSYKVMCKLRKKPLPLETICKMKKWDNIEDCNATLSVMQEEHLIMRNNDNPNLFQLTGVGRHELRREDLYFMTSFATIANALIALAMLYIAVFH